MEQKLEAKLRVQLDGAIKAAEENYSKGRLRRSKKVAQDDPGRADGTTKKVGSDDLFAVQSGPTFIYESVRRKLLKAHIWAKVQRIIAEETIKTLGANLLRKRQRATEKESYPLPGFELPLSVRVGKETLILGRMPFSRCVDYKTRYDKRAQKDQRQAEELQRLIETIEPFAKDNPDITVAEALDRANAAAGRPRLAVVSGKKRGV